MNGDQLLRIAVALARSSNAAGSRLCAASVEVLGVTGAGITVMGGASAGPLCVSDERIRALEDLQYTSGEGPCQDAFVTQSSVAVASLDAAAWARWPGFVGVAASIGIGAVFAYPLSAPGASVGVLTVYQDAPGSLTNDQHDDCLVLAQVLTGTVLSWQVSAEEVPVELEPAVAYRAQIHQAAGMVAVQLQISTDEALARIRAHAFAHSIPVDRVAADIVARRLRLADDRDPT